jgi:hypothetical protein
MVLSSSVADSTAMAAGTILLLINLASTFYLEVALIPPFP